MTLQDGTFPPTRYSVVVAAQSDDLGARSLAIEAITAAYWRPVYKYVRMKWNINSEDAADFTQEFFANLLEKEFLNSYDSRKGRLRTFLRTCADRLFMNQMRDSKRLKRGGGSPHCSLDFEEAERELATIPRSESPEARFDKEWVPQPLYSRLTAVPDQLRVWWQNDPLRVVRALRSPGFRSETVLQPTRHEVRARDHRRLDHASWHS